MEQVEKKEKIVPVCFLCGKDKEDIEGKDLKDFIEGEDTFACYECLAVAAINEYQDLHHPKKPWYKTKINWGFWVLIGGFIAFIVTWFVIKPRLGG